MLEVQVKLTSEQIIGALLWEIAHGRLDDETVAMVDQLTEEYISGLVCGLRDIVRYIWGMNMDPAARPDIIRDLQAELRLMEEPC